MEADRRVRAGVVAGALAAILCVAVGLLVGPTEGMSRSGLVALGFLEAEPTNLRELRRSLVPPSETPVRLIGLEDPSGEAMASFHRALARARRGDGQARITVYGGSHTAGDHYTGRMRTILQGYFGDAGHGFVNLVPVVPRQWRMGMVIDDAEGWTLVIPRSKAREVDRYGLAGAAFVSADIDSMAAVSSDAWGNGRSASRLEVLYDRVPGGGTMEVWVDGLRAASLSTHADPPEPGHSVFEVSDATHRVEVRATGDGPIRVYGVVSERDRPGVLVDNLGLVGSKARHQLLWDEELWRAFFVSRRPDLVILAYGGNESHDRHLTVAGHRRHFHRVIERIRRAAPDASCLLVGPTDRAHRDERGVLRLRATIAPLNEMIREVAAERGCAFFDTLAFQGGAGASLSWLNHEPPYMRDDLIHLTAIGYRRWGEVLTRALLAGYADPS